MIRTAFLLTLLTMLFVLVGYVVGGRTGMIVALAIGLGLNFFNYWFSGSLVMVVRITFSEKWCYPVGSLGELLILYVSDGVRYRLSRSRRSAGTLSTCFCSSKGEKHVGGNPSQCRNLSWWPG